jgi:sec-independent protein translocase protein TatA
MVLFLNDIAGSEVLLILVFILIFFGSKSIPGIARTMGKTMRQIRDASAEVQDEIRKSSQEMKKEMNFSHLLNDTVDTLEQNVAQPLDQFHTDVEDAIQYQAPRKDVLPVVETEEVLDATENQPALDQNDSSSPTEKTSTESKEESSQ